MIKTHWCGCVTRDEDGVVYFDKTCDTHRTRGRPWLALQHNAELDAHLNSAEHRACLPRKWAEWSRGWNHSASAESR